MATLSDKAAFDRIARASVALDLGTTTVSASLCDAATGRVAETVSHLNPQSFYGADVLSRITACMEGKTEKLFERINLLVQKILSYFTEKYSLSGIDKLVVAGNTVMSHLFIGESAAGMGEYPFTPVFLSEKKLCGKELGLPVKEVFLFPSVSPFVGGDITSGIYATEIYKSDKPVMLVDIGTNGEIALRANGRFYFSSAAAGPAFEGAEISCGLGGVDGAVNRVVYERGRIKCFTIGGADPIGICGAGLVDTVAMLLRLGQIDKSGAFTDGETAKSGFKIAENVTLTAKDIRKFQLAKSAIVTGIVLLCEAAEIKLKDISEVFVAGGFGFYLNEENAVYTGLLPKEFAGKTTACGNTSLNGCVKFISGARGEDGLRGLIGEKTILNLADSPKFEHKFIDNTVLCLI